MPASTRNSTPSRLLPPPVRRFREHLREIRRVAGETQQEVLDARAALDEQLAQLDALNRDQVTRLWKIEARLDQLNGSVEPVRVERLEQAAPQRPAASTKSTTAHPAEFDYQAAVAALVAAGAPEETVKWGSIPPESLAFICETIRNELPPQRAAIALHVGNFVGISLVGVTSALRHVHPESLTVAVDPGVTMGGIAHPQDHVTQLLELFGLVHNVLLVCGYSFGPTVPDSRDAGQAPQPTASLDQPNVSTASTAAEEIEQPPPSGENVLPMLARLGARYDLALLDGDHGEQTVAAELRYLTDTLRPGGVVFLDDACDWCPAILELFRYPGERFEQAGHDGRVGVLRFVR